LNTEFEFRYQEIEQISASLKQLFQVYILRHMSVSLEAAERMALWADQNRKEFLDRLESNLPLGEIDLSQVVSQISNLPNKRARTRKLGAEPDEWTPRGVFLMFGKEHTNALLRSGNLDSSAEFQINFLKELENSFDLNPWLSLIAKGLADKASIDTAFCTYQLPLIILSMASNNSTTRTAAYCLIDQVYSFLSTDDERVRDLKERRQIKLLLDVLRNSTDEYQAIQPLPRALFCALSAPILCQPSHPLYPIMNSLLLSRPVLPTAGIPFFDNLVESTEAHDACLRFMFRMRDYIIAREGASLPDWQAVRLQVLNMIKEITV
jgi:hypothetical protein